MYLLRRLLLVLLLWRESLLRVLREGTACCERLLRLRTIAAEAEAC